MIFNKSAIAILALALSVFLVKKAPGDFVRLWVLMSGGVPQTESTASYDKAFVNVVGNGSHDFYDGDVTKSFYNIVSDFYEYGWGECFHFGLRHKNESLAKGIVNSEQIVAQKLRVTNGDQVLDMGMGIGGPLREIVKLTGATITGITINEHQVKRANQITSNLSKWMKDRCAYDVQDYNLIKGYRENYYDAVYYIESTIHSEDHTVTWKEAFRLLKPGGRLVTLEWVTLDAYDNNDPEMSEMMRKNVYGNCLAKSPSIEEDLEMMRKSGFEVLEHFDLNDLSIEMYGENVWEWWQDLDWNYFPSVPQAHPVVRWILDKVLYGFYCIGLVDYDVYNASKILDIAAEGLLGLGKLKAYTPQYLISARKPL